ncbi:MAG: YihY/virulence factor BrkB family protein [Bryobacterales bacterium]|nr:YihY/virulence factor BrkB family protein [Bryobacterales bacterium]
MVNDLRVTWLVLRRAVVSALRDGCFGTAKAAAYSGLLSFIPILSALATLLVEFRAEQMARWISQYLFIAIPPGTEDLVAMSFRARGGRPVPLIVGATLLSLWAASGVMASLMEGFHAAYRIPHGRSMVRGRLVAIWLVLSAAGPVVIASALLVVGVQIERWIMEALGWVTAYDLQSRFTLLAAALRHLTALLAISAGAAGLYYYGPNRPQQWRFVWPGALVATVLWLAATLGFAWWVRNIAHYNVMYGSIGAVIALLVWMYVLSVIALIGCEYNAELERVVRRYRNS